jgi:hypothetical protein
VYILIAAPDNRRGAESLVEQFLFQSRFYNEHTQIKQNLILQSLSFCTQLSHAPKAALTTFLQAPLWYSICKYLKAATLIVD